MHYTILPNMIDKNKDRYQVVAKCNKRQPGERLKARADTYIVDNAYKPL